MPLTKKEEDQLYRRACRVVRIAMGKNRRGQWNCDLDPHAAYEAVFAIMGSHGRVDLANSPSHEPIRNSPVLRSQ